MWYSMEVNFTYATVAELVDALDSKSSGKPYGFESHQWYQNKICTSKRCVFLFCIWCRTRKMALNQLSRWTVDSHAGESHQWYQNKICTSKRCIFLFCIWCRTRKMACFYFLFIFIFFGYTVHIKIIRRNLYGQ